MRKFVVHTRALPGCCKTSDAPIVMEVEGEMISPMEDPSVMWMPESEFKFRILKPESLYEPQTAKDGTKVMMPPVYHSHAIYYNIYQAQVAAEHIIRQSFEFTKRKEGTEFTEEEVRAKFSEITEILL